MRNVESSYLPGESSTYDYEFFRQPEDRQLIYQCSRATVEFVRQNQIPNIVLIDRNARPFYAGLQEYWRLNHAKEPMPNIFFLNPKGFKSQEHTTPKMIELLQKCEKYKEDLIEDPIGLVAQADIEREFNQSYRGLCSDKTKPLLIFDVCIHSGDTLKPIITMLKQSGFERLLIGAVGKPFENGTDVKPDFCVFRRQDDCNCHPFGREAMVNKTFGHVFSVPNSNPEDRDWSARLRSEIRQVIREENEIATR